MPLPKISTPTYELELPSTGKPVKYRPFLVREEKLLVLAMESEDTKQITEAVKEVIKNCIQTRGIKVETLPTFDIEYLFLNIRGKSVGEELEVNLICPDDEETTVLTKINVEDIKVKKDSEHSPKIKVDEHIVMEMKYPSLDEFIRDNFDVNATTIDKSFELIASCIDKIYNEDEVWSAADVTKKELMEFLDQMNSGQFKQVEKFFETMPKLTHEVKVTNPNTGVQSTIVLEGLSSFFA
jgi:secreted Zn-dependent insulinase-like peptidase